MSDDEQPWIDVGRIRIVAMKARRDWIQEVARILSHYGGGGLLKALPRGCPNETMLLEAALAQCYKAGLRDGGK